MSSLADFEDALARRAVTNLGGQFTDSQKSQLAEYCELLWQWNQRVNLTRHTDFDAFVCRDLTDTLQLASLLEESESVIDIGTGGGVPGLPLSILRPDLQLALSESVAKKAAALQAMVDQLQLPVVVHHARVEDLLHDFTFQAATARAVGPLWKMCKWLRPHWDRVGRLLAVKGPRWVEERKEARHRGVLKGIQVRRAASYVTPGTKAENVILKIWKT